MTGEQENVHGHLALKTHVPSNVHGTSTYPMQAQNCTACGLAELLEAT